MVREESPPSDGDGRRPSLCCSVPILDRETVALTKPRHPAVESVWLLLMMMLQPLLLTGCVGVPDGVEPVTGFEVERYLGKWYEIARLDHGFERGLTHVTAEYAPRDDGGLRVVNSGYSAKAGEWKEATGRAYFVGDEDVASLKVSFFGPFFGGYNVIALDRDDYQWALVSGPNRGYLWILARERTLAPAIRERLVARARELEFAADDLIWVPQTPAPIADRAE